MFSITSYTEGDPPGDVLAYKCFCLQVTVKSRAGDQRARGTSEGSCSLTLKASVVLPFRDKHRRWLCHLLRRDGICFSLEAELAMTCSADY